MRVAAAIVVLLTLAGLAWSQQTGKTSQQKDPGFEYWLVEVEETGIATNQAVQERLNTLGSGGWELVDVRAADGKEGVLWLFMKRRAK